MEQHHHRFLFFSLVAVVLGGLITGGGYWAYWNFYERFRPVTIAKNQVEIQRLLDEADWVSPGRGGAPIYMITYRDCSDCTTYQRDEFPKLAAANVDTRVIVFARPDREGLQQSTSAERATIAELWINRDWNLYARWMATPHKDWTADGLKPSDHDFARNAVVNASRDFVGQLAPLIKGAGLGDTYPILIWRDRDGFLKACACTDERSYHFIRTDLGAPGKASEIVNAIESALGSSSSAKPAAKSPAPAAAAPAPAAQPAAQPAAPAPATAAPAAQTTPPQAAQTRVPPAGDTAPARTVLAQGGSPASARGGRSNARAIFY
jgi:hypothetical protein